MDLSRNWASFNDDDDDPVVPLSPRISLLSKNAKKIFNGSEGEESYRKHSILKDVKHLSNFRPMNKYASFDESKSMLLEDNKLDKTHMSIQGSAYCSAEDIHSNYGPVSILGSNFNDTVSTGTNRMTSHHVPSNGWEPGLYGGRDNNYDPNALLDTRIEGTELIITHFLGIGSYGAIYCAHNSRLDETVAAKAIPSDQDLTEVTTLMAVQENQGVIKVHEIIETSDIRWIIMDLADTDLYDVIKEGVNYETALSIFRQVVNTIVYLHECGISHRDIKPDNILAIYSADSINCKLADFGLATFEERSTVSCGTKNYVSPENFSGDYDTKANDVWALGVLLVNLLTGRGLPIPENPSSPYEHSRAIEELVVSTKILLILKSIFVDEEKRISSKKIIDILENYNDEQVEEEILNIFHNGGFYVIGADQSGDEILDRKSTDVSKSFSSFIHGTNMSVLSKITNITASRGPSYKNSTSKIANDSILENQKDISINGSILSNLSKDRAKNNLNSSDENTIGKEYHSSSYCHSDITSPDYHDDITDSDITKNESILSNDIVSSKGNTEKPTSISIKTDRILESAPTSATSKAVYRIFSSPMAHSKVSSPVSVSSPKPRTVVGGIASTFSNLFNWRSHVSDANNNSDTISPISPSKNSLNTVSSDSEEEFTQLKDSPTKSVPENVKSDVLNDFDTSKLNIKRKNEPQRSYMYYYRKSKFRNYKEFNEDKNVSKLENYNYNKGYKYEKYSNWHSDRSHRNNYRSNFWNQNNNTNNRDYFRKNYYNRYQNNNNHTKNNNHQETKNDRTVSNKAAYSHFSRHDTSNQLTINAASQTYYNNKKHPNNINTSPIKKNWREPESKHGIEDNRQPLSVKSASVVTSKLLNDLSNALDSKGINYTSSPRQSNSLWEISNDNHTIEENSKSNQRRNSHKRSQSGGSLQSVLDLPSWRSSPNAQNSNINMANIALSRSSSPYRNLNKNNAEISTSSRSNNKYSTSATLGVTIPHSNSTSVLGNCYNKCDIESHSHQNNMYYQNNAQLKYSHSPEESHMFTKYYPSVITSIRSQSAGPAVDKLFLPWRPNVVATGNITHNANSNMKNSKSSDTSLGDTKEYNEDCNYQNSSVPYNPESNMWWRNKQSSHNSSSKDLPVSNYNHNSSNTNSRRSSQHNISNLSKSLPSNKYMNSDYSNFTNGSVLNYGNNSRNNRNNNLDYSRNNNRRGSDFTKLYQNRRYDHNIHTSISKEELKNSEEIDSSKIHNHEEDPLWADETYYHQNNNHNHNNNYHKHYYNGHRNSTASNKDTDDYSSADDNDDDDYNYRRRQRT